MKVCGALLLLVVLTGLFLLFRDDQASGEAPESVSPEVRAGRDAESVEAGKVRLLEGNSFIENYGEEEGTIESDLASLRDIVRDCQLLLKDFDRYHLPGNREIIEFLQGENPDRLAWIPQGHDMLNDDGELVDRYRTPVFFHRLSGMRFEYRSAGPDRRHWTDDDIVLK